MVPNPDMKGTLQDPKWSLERRESSGHLVWRKESPSSKVRFRFDVEVLEFEKQPHEDIEESNDGFSLGNITSTIVFCATCVVGVAVSIFLPWYLMEKAISSSL
ncbi:uncharacterized protein LOC101460910 isoform X3 [Ceratitis capitata]|uniref:Uncharacterized protein n=3 Tax=Ceratitis capitata TaxID=7213 RepID=W8C9V1_CERCA|nr:uncharacterized protein LOC101460910 isoform X2 [Ceratitis capitata]XP_004524331.1 uncharacterized protein LOC101460910 isoform X3 [Ceratitis capitata]